ncbi:MAG: MBL fold metallo-hydrolase [Clostridiaceae bacterium]
MKFCSLYSGSSGNSIFISSDNTSVLVDAGLSGKSIESAMTAIDENIRDIKAILISHEHIDHIKGAGILSRKYNIPIYANEKTWAAMESSMDKLKPENKRIINGEASIGDLNVRTFKVPHDSAACIGFTIEDRAGKLISTVTDMGVFTREIKEGIKDSDIILIESNHDIEMLKYGPYPYNLKLRVLSELGHLSNEDCARAVLEILGEKERKIVLGHLSGTNNVPELAMKTVESIIIEKGAVIGENKDLTLKLASRIRPSAYTEIK